MGTTGHDKAQQPLHTSSSPEPVNIVVHSSNERDNATEENSTGTQEDMEDIQMSALFS